MSAALDQVAPAFVEMAHRIVWAGAATVDADGRPWSRILHPLWSWDGAELTGIVATSPRSPKAGHLAAHPHIAFTYWQPDQDTCSVMCDAAWDDSAEGRAAGWEALATAPAPVGYDPSMIPGWDGPEAPTFGILRLRPWRVSVMPGTVLMGQGGEILTWTR
jgi:hypothetical protein